MVTKFIARHISGLVLVPSGRWEANPARPALFERAEDALVAAAEALGRLLDPEPELPQFQAVQVRRGWVEA